jgi:DNA-binding NtrC family response regulator
MHIYILIYNSFIVRILIAEDEPDIWRPYKIALESRNHKVVITENGKECLNIYNDEFNKESNILLPSSSTITSSKSKNQTKAEDHNKNKNKNKNKLMASTTTTTTTASSSSHPLHPSSSPKHSPFDAVVLDYRIPEKDGMEVAKEILELNPEQRIIFASAYVKETLEDAVKQLKQVVELMQKPFDADVLVDTIEDKEVHDGIKKLMTNLKQTKDLEEPTLENMRDLFEGLRKIQKGRTF